jgi:hypothetical protein
MMGVAVPNRHPLLLTLLCATFLVGLAHSFVPHKVLLSSPLWRNRHPLGCRAIAAKDPSFVRFASPLPDEEQQMTPQVTFTESPEWIFQQLAVVNNNNNDNDDSSFLVVGMEELKQWGELQDLLSDEEITSTELQDMFAEAIAITKGTNNNDDDKLDKAGFVLLYKSIDNIFVYEDHTDEGEISNVGGNDSIIDAVQEVTTTTTTGSEDPKSLPNNKQDELLSFLSDIHSVPDADKLPCGMDCTDKEREIIANLVKDLEADPNNLVLKQNGKIGINDLIGDWDLLYTNSKGIILNKSLSGLGSSNSKNTFSSVRQRLTGSK